jgi:hypothetical protein
MKISDVLRQLADKIDSANSIPDSPGNTQTDATAFGPATAALEVSVVQVQQ